MSARGKLDRPAGGAVSGSALGRATPQRQHGPASPWASLVHESLDTLILGALSTSLGAVLVIVPLLKRFGSGLSVDIPLTTYLALIPVGTSLGVIGIVRARIAGRFTSSLSTLGALLCFAPASPQVLRSLGIYLLILAPFALVFYGTAMIEKLARWALKEGPDDNDPEDHE
jgi:hypothetical protein